MKNTESLTLIKRLISSLIFRVFDSLSFAAPLTIRAKLLLRDLWLEGRDLDQPISEEIENKFCIYYCELQFLSHFAIPRLYFTKLTQKFDLLGFCDASERAYGTVVYICANYKSMLVRAKTRVVPLKRIIIRRLELLSVALLVKLLKQVYKISKQDLTYISACVLRLLFWHS